MAKDLPELLSIRQYAAYLGKSYMQVWNALHRGRIPRSQYVDGTWVIAKDATILRSGLENDPLIANLPAEFISEGVVKYPSAIPENKKIVRNWKPTGDSRKVVIWGYNDAVKDMGIREIYRITGVHPSTQKKLRDEEPVQPSVVWSLSRNLGIEPEDLLRKRR